MAVYIKYVIFKNNLMIDIMDISCEIVLIWMPRDHIDDNIDSGNGLAQSGNKRPLTKPTLTHYNDAQCHHQQLMS